MRNRLTLAPVTLICLMLSACTTPKSDREEDTAATGNADGTTPGEGGEGTDGTDGADGTDGTGSDGGSDGGGEVHDPPIGADLVRYLPDGSGLQFRDGLRLSDGTFLLVGRVDHLDWVPEGATQVALDPLGSDSAGVGIAVLVQLSEDLQEVQTVLHFPENTIEEIGRVRDTALRGQPTGLLTISGRRTVSSWERDGYMIARLDNNFVDGLPTGLTWLVDVSAKPRNAGGRTGQSAYEELQPWDVNAAGEVYYGTGAEYDYD